MQKHTIFIAYSLIFIYLFSLIGETAVRSECQLAPWPLIFLSRSVTKDFNIISNFCFLVLQYVKLIIIFFNLSLISLPPFIFPFLPIFISFRVCPSTTALRFAVLPHQLLFPSIHCTLPSLQYGWTTIANLKSSRSSTYHLFSSL